MGATAEKCLHAARRMTVTTTNTTLFWDFRSLVRFHSMRSSFGAASGPAGLRARHPSPPCALTLTDMMAVAHGGGNDRSDCIADTNLVQNLQASGAASQHPSSCFRDHIGKGGRTCGTCAFGYLRTHTDVPCSKDLMMLKCSDLIGIGVFLQFHLPFFFADHNM